MATSRFYVVSPITRARFAASLSAARSATRGCSRNATDAGKPWRCSKRSCSERMHRVLIAAEIQNLLEPAQLENLAITWLATADPTPRGDWVAIVPLLTR